jgi:transposase-like protein
MSTRRSKYTPERRAELVRLLARGHSRMGAAGALGVTRRTVQRWIKRDPDLAMEIDRATARSVYLIEKVLLRASSNAVITMARQLLKQLAYQEWKHSPPR